MIDNFRLNRRRALITGSVRGIGLALARGLAQAGAQVVLNGRDAERAQGACSLLRDEGLDAEYSVFDVTTTRPSRRPSMRWKTAWVQ